LIVNPENSPAVPSQSSATNSAIIPQSDEERPPSKWPIHDPLLREVKDVIRVPVDNYQLTTLATVKHRSDIIESVDDNDKIEWTEDPYECKSATEGSSLIYSIQIQGPPSLRQTLRALCEEYSDIIDTAVRAEPADIPPISIKIDETKWKSNKHRLPPRTHSVDPRLDSSATNC